MNGLKFDRTINLGHVLMIITMITAIAVAYATYRVTVSEYDHRIKSLERNAQGQSTLTRDLSQSLYTISRDVAVIKDRIERGQK